MHPVNNNITVMQKIIQIDFPWDELKEMLSQVVKDELEIHSKNEPKDDCTIHVYIRQ